MNQPVHEHSNVLPSVIDLAWLWATARRDVLLLGAVFALGILLTGHAMFKFLAVGPSEPWRQARCRQCRHEWWDDFWHWRFSIRAARSNATARTEEQPPTGMVWEWGDAVNDTDWFGASAELVESVIKVHADPALGPVLQIGCGDSPLPALLHQAGFGLSEHLDIAPQVISGMRSRYPAAEWPGLQFHVRDFLANGARPPAHRFGLVIDKAGLWDWLQDEAPETLPHLLDRVHSALLPASQQPAYVLVTKQRPSQFSQTLVHIAAGAGSRFHVEATLPLGSEGVAWAYVLAPAL